jgi:restriction system protein
MSTRRRSHSRRIGSNDRALIFVIGMSVLLIAVSIVQFLWLLIARNPPVAVVIAVCLLVIAISRLSARATRWHTAERQRIEYARDISTLLAVSPKEFEHTVGAVLRASGFDNIDVRGNSSDLAGDITCTDPDGAAVVVQCKQHSLNGSVGALEVQTFIGMAFAHHRADRALFVTAADYTRGARDLASEHHIELLNGSDLLALASCARS